MEKKLLYTRSETARLLSICHWTYIRTLHCVGNGICPNKKTLLTVMVGSVFFVSKALR